MTTIYLKFPDEATAMTVLADYRNDEHLWISASHTHALDVVGTIYEDDVPLDGFHVNFIGTLPPGAEQYVVHPATPARMFA